jgi:hypothetical protein
MPRNLTPQRSCTFMNSASGYTRAKERENYVKLIEKDDGGRERENEKGGSGECAVHCATN